VYLKEFQVFVSSLQVAASTKRRIIASFKSLFAFSMRIGYLRFNVVAAVRAPKVMDKLAERILAESQIHTMIALTADRRNKLMLRILHGSGVRVSELCGLKWRDLQPNGDSGQLSVFGKGGKTRWIVLPFQLWQDLLEFRGDAPDTAPVFGSRKQGGHLDASQVLRIVRAAARRAGIKSSVSPHWIRHCHATHALQRGAAINLVADTLGHSNVAITGKYLHSKPNDSSAKYLAV
jgi:integrase/recombinase XerD